MSRLDNNDPEDRRRLVEALWSAGFSASEYDSGGGTVHVVAPLLDTGGDLLWIATGAIDSPCDISLMGWRGEQQVQANTRMAVEEIEDAVIHFELYWQERELWLERFHLGEFDL